MIDITDGTHHLFNAGAGDAERHAALFHVRTGDIQFDGGHIVKGINDGRCFDIILDIRAADINNHVSVEMPYPRIDGVYEIIYTFILKAHAVEHSHWCLGHTRIRVPLAMMQSGAFYDNAAKL